MKPLNLVIFGITSNLSQIKLLPALYDLAEKKMLPEDLAIIGNARRPLSREEFAQFITNALTAENKSHKHPVDPEIVQQLVAKMEYLPGDVSNLDYYQALKQNLKYENTIFYLATYPDLYHTIFNNLQQANLNKNDSGFVRVMIEKPIGHDLESAKELNQLLAKYFSEDQIYRLDHYLGKETLQNILAFRFSNEIIAHLMDNSCIDHIQISALESFGIGQRGGYYDKVGALKDVGQNHQLQMLAFATMDAPDEFSNRAITDQRIKILQNLVPIPEKVVFGQYQGYTNEENVDPNSTTETFYAFKTFINTPQWKDIPIYVRAGKMVGLDAPEVAEISIVFKQIKNALTHDFKAGFQSNALIYRIQPNEGIVLKILTKKPGHSLELESEYMQFCYRSDPHQHYIPDPYEKLIIDTIEGNQTFFNDAEEVEAQWAFVDQLLAEKKTPEIYQPGSWGPQGAKQLIEEDGRTWLEPSMDFCLI